MRNENPRHIAIILDGNRRWARAKGLPPWEGHRKGLDKLGDLFKWAKELDIRELSLYCFSVQNFDRDPKEVAFLMDLFVKTAEKALKNEDVHKNKVKIRFLGRLGMLPEKVQQAAKRVMDATKEYDNYILNLCMAYGGREEIVDGVNRVIEDVKAGKIDSVDEKSFQDFLYLKSDPDIVIRTGGDKRISNFLLWHINYSELFFLDTYWPAFSREDIASVIEEYKKRNRRYGK
ncbi:MAG: polyprenyl diphosphate synthase [Candidatus Woesearchaeota archaeon]